MFRQAAPASPAWNLGKTVLQIIVFWGVFLAALPALVVGLERHLGLPRFGVSGQRPVAAALFMAFSVVGLSSGVTMAWIGGGTPLPLDGPRNLVVRGPYAHVRNPMAIAGLGQGLAVGLWLGSWLMPLVVVVGGLLWQVFVRPREERDLLHRFGASYERYRSEVRCWWPRLRPFRPPGGG